MSILWEQRAIPAPNGFPLGGGRSRRCRCRAKPPAQRSCGTSRRSRFCTWKSLHAQQPQRLCTHRNCRRTHSRTTCRPPRRSLLRQVPSAHGQQHTHSAICQSSFPLRQDHHPGDTAFRSEAVSGVSRGVWTIPASPSTISNGTPSLTSGSRSMTRIRGAQQSVDSATRLCATSNTCALLPTACSCREVAGIQCQYSISSRGLYSGSVAGVRRRRRGRVFSGYESSSSPGREGPVEPKDIPGISQLTTPEKIILIEDLWDEVRADDASVSVPESHKHELDRRARNHRDNPGRLLSLGELQARVSSRK